MITNYDHHLSLWYWRITFGPDTDEQLNPEQIDADARTDPRRDNDGCDSDDSEEVAELQPEEHEHRVDVPVPSDRCVAVAGVEEINAMTVVMGELKEKPKLGEDETITSPEDQQRRMYMPAASVVLSVFQCLPAASTPTKANRLSMR
jgi:hypothetical protein